ncbi:hypothetical protein F5B17DRAFT_261440 [Nemania serpens]|nr:hypothetical protein F5B17DRAFT_261440 [Nemania serpens]
MDLVFIELGPAVNGRDGSQKGQESTLTLARLCLPESSQGPHAIADTLQVFVHGASFNKNMGGVQYRPETYS